jgi:hypothetical protein
MIYYTEISSQAIGFPPTAPASPLRQDDSLDASIGKDPLPLSALIKPLNFETLHFASNATTQEVPLNAKPTSIIPSTQRAIVTPVMGKTLNMTVKEVKVRAPTADEALVKILYTGICGSVSLYESVVYTITNDYRMQLSPQARNLGIPSLTT